VGIATFFAWVTILRYLEYSKQYSMLQRTFINAMPHVIRTIVNVVAIFLGFAMLGMSLFWRSYRF